MVVEICLFCAICIKRERKMELSDDLTNILTESYPHEKTLIYADN